MKLALTADTKLYFLLKVKAAIYTERLENVLIISLSKLLVTYIKEIIKMHQIIGTMFIAAL